MVGLGLAGEALPALLSPAELGAAVCEFFHRGLCTKGVRCPFRHVAGEKTVVCKHWLRGLCKKGDGCDFLHEYDATKMPECYFYSKFGECSNKDCPFLHIDATTSTVGCPWYDRGFCRHGPLCKYKHTRRVMCANYLVGFCPEGPKCKFMHLKAGLMTSSKDPSKSLPKQGICFKCRQKGHYASECEKTQLEILLGK
nr:PREDICTED: cleavage and polyadenylation specificity factor subunit 4-like [Balearica regulorum gibbericeps]